MLRVSHLARLYLYLHVLCCAFFWEHVCHLCEMCWVVSVAKVAVDNVTESTVCSHWWSWRLVDESARRAWFVCGDTFHCEFMSRNTVLPFLLLYYASDFDMLAWDGSIKSYFLPCQKYKFKGAPKSQWGHACQYLKHSIKGRRVQ